MRKMQLAPAILAGMVVFGGLAGGVKAASVTYGPTPFGSFTAGATGTFNVPQFDPSLGTLTEIDLYVTGDSNGGSNGVENINTQIGGAASASIGTNITVSGPSSLTVLTLPATSNTQLLTPYDGIVDFGGTSGFTVVGLPSTDSQSNSIFSGFAPYLGLGNVGFNYGSASNTSTSVGVTPNLTSATAPTFDFTTKVVYTYNAVPEPTSIGLFCLATLGFFGRRRA